MLKRWEQHKRGILAALVLAEALATLAGVWGNVLWREVLADSELRDPTPLTLRIVQRETGAYTNEEPLDPPTTFEYPDSADARTLYRVLRTRAESEYGGGCRIVGGLAGDGAKAYDYQVTFLRGDTIMLDAYLPAGCVYYALSKEDPWYARHLTNASAYSAGTYFLDRDVKASLYAATGLGQ